MLLLSGCNKPATQDAKSPLVYIEKTKTGYRLIRDGQPFFIKGAATSPRFLEDLKLAGGNTARIYDTINMLQTLDKAEELGLAVVIDISLPTYNKDPEFFEDQDLFKDMEERVIRFIKRYKDHPAILYWNLGNELHYPGFYRRRNFFSNFDSLIEKIRIIDPNHPITTVVAGAHRNRLTSIALRNPDLDFLSFNIFGALSHLHERIEFNKLIWEGPYVISEWGTNGPWEEAENETAWKTPIEKTSTEKAKIITERYFEEAMQNDACLGNFIFYWGNKQERTHTWFSIFLENGYRSQIFHTMKNLWNEQDIPYNGPQITAALLNNKLGSQDIVIKPGTAASGHLELDDPTIDSLSYHWEVLPEAWFERMDKPLTVDVGMSETNSRNITFTTPTKEGPYRLFVYVYDRQKNFATANIPFYVLNPRNGE